jgi:hypothetical protein
MFANTTEVETGDGLGQRSLNCEQGRECKKNTRYGIWSREYGGLKTNEERNQGEENQKMTRKRKRRRKIIKRRKKTRGGEKEKVE